MWRLLLLVTPVLTLRMIEPPLPEPTTRSTPIEGWFTARLNQFDASNTETFQMRYYYNNEFASSGHMVIFVGGEWAISPGWTTSGLAYELASRIGAGLFYTEHRYYGQTRPTNDTNASDLRYLNVDQALGDLAQFIQHVKSDDFEQGRYRAGKVALVGCSYAGSMATWMRLGYPHLVSAVFSDSGPLHAQEDFPEYLEVIAKAIKEQGSEACLSSIERGMQSIVELLETQAGVDRISQLFNPVEISFLDPFTTQGIITYTNFSISTHSRIDSALFVIHTCTPLQASSPLDRATFFWYGITETFAYLVQLATPGDIPTACDAITNTTQDNSLERLAAWVSAHPWTQPCIESRYSEQVRIHTNLSYDAPGTDMRLWTYQTCVEYGWYQTTSSGKQPFLNTVPLEYFHQMCKDFFGIEFNESRLRSGVARTNNLFAGLTYLPDHVVSVAGAHDPWSPMGPDASHAGYFAPVHVVDGISHCRAIRPTGTNETDELERTKLEVLLQMQKWMLEYMSSASAAALSPLLVGAAIYITLFN